MDHIKARLTSQVEEAKHELDAYQPASVDWYQCCRRSVNQLVPWLYESATGLRVEIDSLLESPRLVREAWERIKHETEVPDQLAEEMDQALAYESILVKRPSGMLISKIIERYLIDHCPNRALKSNGASDYPDLFVSDFDYSFLTPHTRSADTYAASLKGGRPVRIPDGIEIKTIVGRGGIDCHYPHVGLHLIVLLENEVGGASMRVTDIRLGFARHDTYRITKPRKKATTLKASFNATTVRSDAFPSLIGQ